MHCYEETGLPGAEIPLQPVDITILMQVVSLQPMDNNSEADSHTAAHGGLHAIAGEYALKEAVLYGKHMHNRAPGSNCVLCRHAHTGAGFLALDVAHRGPTLKRSVSGGLYSMGRIHAEAVFKNYNA